MKHDITKNPPQYAPQAIATEAGWVDHQTGELLVAVKLNVASLKKPSAQIAKPMPTIAPTEIVTEAPTEIVTEAPVQQDTQKKRPAK